MRKFVKTGKRGIVSILTLCILLVIAGTCLNVTAMVTETVATVEETAVATEEITTVVVEESTISTEEPIVATEDTTVVTEENTQELVPVMARGCSNYDYNSYTMNQLKIEKGWTLRMDGDVDHYIIYSGSTAVGKYHTGLNNGQDPHFHLYASPGVHYILGGI